MSKWEHLVEMSDEELRRLERLWKESGDLAAGRRYRRELLKRGEHYGFSSDEERESHAGMLSATRESGRFGWDNYMLPRYNEILGLLTRKRTATSHHGTSTYTTVNGQWRAPSGEIARVYVTLQDTREHQAQTGFGAGVGYLSVNMSWGKLGEGWHRGRGPARREWYCNGSVEVTISGPTYHARAYTMEFDKPSRFSKVSGIPTFTTQFDPKRGRSSENLQIVRKHYFKSGREILNLLHSYRDRVCIPFPQDESLVEADERIRELERKYAQASTKNNFARLSYAYRRTGENNQNWITLWVNKFRELTRAINASGSIFEVYNGSYKGFEFTMHVHEASNPYWAIRLRLGTKSRSPFREWGWSFGAMVFIRSDGTYAYSTENYAQYYNTPHNRRYQNYSWQKLSPTATPEDIIKVLVRHARDASGSPIEEADEETRRKERSARSAGGQDAFIQELLAKKREGKLITIRSEPRTPTAWRKLAKTFRAELRRMPGPGERYVELVFRHYDAREIFYEAIEVIRPQMNISIPRHKDSPGVYPLDVTLRKAMRGPRLVEVRFTEEQAPSDHPQVQGRGFYNYPQMITYRIGSRTFNHIIGAGTHDSNWLFRLQGEQNRVFLITMNTGLPYVGISEYTNGEETGDAFFQGAEQAEEELGRNWEDISIHQLARRLINYLNDRNY